MPLCGVTTDEKLTIPLSGGARAVRPWGGWRLRSDHPPRLAPPLLSLRDRCRCASHPSGEGIFLGTPSNFSSNSSEPNCSRGSFPRSCFPDRF